mmetsp:Transcript_24152/g.67824  ORF Transcript_24152/g.67824 Transcript_24152/m.67824 type:complete len:228 (+) Transcript_24152:315-998(+)
MLVQPPRQQLVEDGEEWVVAHGGLGEGVQRDARVPQTHGLPARSQLHPEAAEEADVSELRGLRELGERVGQPGQLACTELEEHDVIELRVQRVVQRPVCKAALRLRVRVRHEAQVLRGPRRRLLPAARRLGRGQPGTELPAQGAQELPGCAPALVARAIHQEAPGAVQDPRKHLVGDRRAEALRASEELRHVVCAGPPEPAVLDGGQASAQCMLRKTDALAPPPPPR